MPDSTDTPNNDAFYDVTLILDPINADVPTIELYGKIELGRGGELVQAVKKFLLIPATYEGGEYKGR